MDPNYLNFQMGSQSEFVSMVPYIYQPQNLYYLPHNDASQNPNYYPVVQNEAQSNLMNPIIINNQQQQQPIMYSIPPTNAAATTTSVSQQQQPQQPTQQAQTSKAMPSENDPFFIPIQGIVPPTKNADGRYECNICNRTYTHAKHLKRHTMRHTGQKPYECAYCSAKFTRPDIRTRHALKCRLQKLKESNGGTLPENVQASALTSKASKNASVKKNSHPATSAATKAIFKCAPQVPSAITAMNRAKNVAAAAAAASLATNILSSSAQTKTASASFTSVHKAAPVSSSATTSPLANSVVLSPSNSTPEQPKPVGLIPTPELQPCNDYPTPVSVSSSPSTQDKAYSFPQVSGEGLPGYITPVEPQLSMFTQQVSQAAFVDPELCHADPVSVDQMYPTMSSINPTTASMPATADALNNTYAIYNGAYTQNSGLMLNVTGIPVSNMSGLVADPQQLLYPVNGMPSNMRWQNYA